MEADEQHHDSLNLNETLTNNDKQNESKDENSLVTTIKTSKKSPKLNTKKVIDRSHIKTIPGIPASYQCEICKKTFKNKKSQCYHDVCVTGIRPYHCNICNRYFIKKSHFEYHERVHSGFKPFQCQLCSKAFPQKNKLNRHMLSHTHEKKFLCSTCGKRYSKQEDLKSHMSVHSGTLPYTCEICNKTFKMRTNLNRHINIHSSDRPFACHHCNKRFKDKSLLVRHERTHSKERPYSCDHCSSVFISKSQLLRHLAIHSDLKPFLCQTCNTSFRRKDNLTRHIRHHHTKDTDNCNNNTEVDKKSKEVKDKKFNINTNLKNPKEKLNSIEDNKQAGLSTKIDKNIYQRINAIGNFIPVIRAPGESSNAVPVINGPMNLKKFEEISNSRGLTYMESIPSAAAVQINQRIEEKLYLQNSSANDSYFFQENPNFQDSHCPIRVVNHQKHSTQMNQQITDQQNTSNLNYSSTSTNKFDSIRSQSLTTKINCNYDINGENNIVKIGDYDKSKKCTILMDKKINDDIIKKDKINIVSSITQKCDNLSYLENDKNMEKSHWRRRTSETLKSFAN